MATSTRSEADGECSTLVAPDTTASAILCNTGQVREKETP